MTDRTPLPAELEWLAAEFVLGLLDEPERLAAQRRALEDPAFAAEMEKWQSVANRWQETLDEKPAAPALWPRIEAATGAGSAAISDLPSSSKDARHGSNRFWRPLAIAASLATCLFTGLWIDDLRERPPAMSRHAAEGIAEGRFSVILIAGSDHPRLATALYDQKHGMMLIRVGSIAGGRARIPEIWLIENGQAPRSLGFGEAGGTVKLGISPMLQKGFARGATLAITMEPLSEHVHPAPSGKILGTGTVDPI